MLEKIFKGYNDQSMKLLEILVSTQPELVFHTHNKKELFASLVSALKLPDFPKEIYSLSEFGKAEFIDSLSKRFNRTLSDYLTFAIDKLNSQCSQPAKYDVLNESAIAALEVALKKIFEAELREVTNIIDEQLKTKYLEDLPETVDIRFNNLVILVHAKVQDVLNYGQRIDRFEIALSLIDQKDTNKKTRKLISYTLCMLVPSFKK